MPETKREPKAFVALSVYVSPALGAKVREFAQAWNLSTSGAVELCLLRQLNGLQDHEVPGEMKRIRGKP